MKTKNILPPVSGMTRSPWRLRHEINSPDYRNVGRRSFVKGLGMAWASVLSASALMTTATRANQKAGRNTGGTLTKGDAAILRFLAALETLETDFWQQYNELGGIQDKEVPGGSGNLAYTNALKKLDSDMDQYIHDNTEDEFTHFTFINAYLVAHGEKPADLDQFRMLPSSQASGADTQKMRLTNLTELTVDTTWWTRYRSRTKNPDFGDTFPPAVPGLAKGEFPAIPRSNADLMPDLHLQAIANTAGFHFASIEQGGSSLYPSLAQRVTDPEVLRILLSIGPTETMHFQTWQDKAGNAPSLTDPTNGLFFPDLTSRGELLSANRIMPEPCPFLSRSLKPCSVIRPVSTDPAVFGATKAVQSLKDEQLFLGQKDAFFDFMTDLATRADSATRQ